MSKVELMIMAITGEIEDLYLRTERLEDVRDLLIDDDDNLELEKVQVVLGDEGLL